MKTLSKRTATFATAITALLLVAAACHPLPHPDPDPGAEEPLAELELSYPGRGTVTLTCRPDGGTHPNPTGACGALRAAGGDFDKLLWSVRDDVACIDIYDPVYARATGTWQASPEGPTFDIDWSREFGNSCYASLYNNVVFDFGKPGWGSNEPLADLKLSYPGRGEATLTCSPDGGTHPHPKAACDALRAVGGDFDQLTWVWKPGLYCIDIYDPVYAHAKGSWQSSPMGPTHLVDWSKEFGNSCYAARSSNVVFNF